MPSDDTVQLIFANEVCYGKLPAQPGTTRRTWCTAVHQCSQYFAVPPVLAEVGDWQIGDFVLDPAQQTLLGCL